MGLKQAPRTPRFSSRLSCARRSWPTWHVADTEVTGKHGEVDEAVAKHTESALAVAGALGTQFEISLANKTGQTQESSAAVALACAH